MTQDIPVKSRISRFQDTIQNNRGFLLVFMSTVALSIANYMTIVSMGWLVLEMTGSPLSLGVVWAIRAAPHLIWGMLAGAVADKIDRRKLILGMFAMLAGSTAIISVLIIYGWIQLWHIFLFIFIVGSLKTFDMTARQALIVDVVGGDHVMRSIALNAVGLRMMGVFGGAGAGVLIEVVGIEAPFNVMIICYIFGIVALSLIRGTKRKEHTERLEQLSLWNYLHEGLNIIVQNQVILVLVILAILCEIFGFSYQVLLPIYARDILEIGAVGLGSFTSMQSLGGLFATLTLATLGNYKSKGRLILTIYLFFGIVLILFAQSPWYLTSLILICLIGGVAAAFDVMQHIILQLNVADQQRGRAMGIWQLSIGFGPVGHLMVGEIADLIGAKLALTMNGVMILVSFLVMVQQFKKFIRS